MGYGVGGEGQLRDRVIGGGGLPLAIYNVFSDVWLLKKAVLKLQVSGQ